RKLATLVRSLNAGLTPTRAAVVTTTFGDYREAVAHMLSAGDQANLKNHATALNDLKLDAVTTPLVQRVLETVIKREFNVGTVRKIQGAIRRVFELAKMDHTLPEAHANPAEFSLQWFYKRIEARPEKDSRPRAIIEDAEFFALIDCPEFLPSDVKEGT